MGTFVHYRAKYLYKVSYDRYRQRFQLLSILLHTIHSKHQFFYPLSRNAVECLVRQDKFQGYIIEQEFCSQTGSRMCHPALLTQLSN